MPYKNPENVKACRARFYQRHKKQVMSEKKALQQRNVRWYRAYKKTVRCERCPEWHPACLDFHHIDPKTKTLSVSKMVLYGYSIKRILEEIAKCMVLCANCHRLEHSDLYL